MRMKIMETGLIAGCLLLLAGPVAGQNIDPYDDGSQYAYGENVGWFNFEPSAGPGVTVYDTAVTGYVWAENIGWVNLNGVLNDGAGNLSGYAWGENVGWINFNPIVPQDPTRYGVTIDSDGNFSGWAWGENIGWVSFDDAAPYNVRVCVVCLIDLTAFAADWLEGGASPANLDGIGIVDLADFSILAANWLNYCPYSWPLP